MSWRDAPLYVVAYDLVGGLLARVTDWPPSHRFLQARLSQAAYDLLEGVSLALTFPQTRAGHLQQADQAVVQVRILLRLACDLSLLSTRQRAHFADQLRDIGRMIGGWRKRVSGAGPPAARIV